MQMEHALTRLFSDVGDHAEAIHTALLGNLRNDLKAVRHNRAVGRINGGHRLDVLLRDHEKMRGSLRVNVIEGVAEVVLVHLARRDIARDDFTEQTIFHGMIAPF